MKLLALAIGLIIAAIGLVGIAAPSILFEFGRALQTTGELYAVTVVRVLFGVILLLAPPTSRMPRTLRVIGILMIVGGLLTPFFGVDRIHAIVDWWSAQVPFVMRALPGIAVILGIFIVYAAGSARRRNA